MGPASAFYWKVKGLAMNGFLNAPAITPLILTLKVAFCSTVLSVFIGTALGILLCRRSFVGRDLLDAALALPMVMPPTVLGYYLIVILGRNGLVGAWLHETLGISLIFTWQGAVLAAAGVSAPLILKSFLAAFEGVDINLQNAARTLGANEMSVFFRITFPLAWRGLLAGSMLAFARAMGEFGATMMVAGNLPGRTQTLSIAVYDAVQAGDLGSANLLVGITSISCLTVLYCAGKLIRQRNHQ